MKKAEIHDEVWDSFSAGGFPKNYLSVLRLWNESTSKNIASASAGDVALFARALAARGTKVSTQVWALNVLAALFAHGVREGFRTSNPARDLVARIGVTASPPSFAAAEQLISDIRGYGLAPRDQLAAALVLYLGIHARYVLDLARDDADEDSLRVGGPFPRVIPLPALLGSAVKSYLKRRDALYPTSSALFPSKSGGLMAEGDLTRSIRRNVGRVYSLTDLRVAGIAELSRRGIALPVVHRFCDGSPRLASTAKLILVNDADLRKATASMTWPHAGMTGTTK